MGRVEYHFVARALLGPSDECGDTGIIKEHKNHCFLALIDALGHGRNAHAVACLALAYLEENLDKALLALMNGLHDHVKGTNGGVAALCRLNIDTGELRYVGIGNITTKIIGMTTATLVPRDGVIGYLMPTPKEQQYILHSGDALILYSDGIRTHFNTLEYPGIFSGNAESIAKNLLNRLGKKDDDASCIVLRYYA